jgi:Tol biopolymer transport system component
MPVAGGQPTRLTQIATAGLSGGFSPDGQWLAYISYRGVGLYRLSGESVTWLVPVTTLGDVIWLGGG